MGLCCEKNSFILINSNNPIFFQLSTYVELPPKFIRVCLENEPLQCDYSYSPFGQALNSNV